MTQPSTILELLQHAAHAYPCQTLAFLDEFIAKEASHMTYRELLAIATDNGRRIRKAGAVGEKGQVVILYFEDSLSNVIWTWSILAAGGVPAIHNPLSRDPKNRAGQFDNLRDLFGRPTVITSEQIAEQFDLLDDCTLYTTNAIANEQICDARPDCAFGSGAHSADSLAVLLFTSGSTGHSKAVEFTHRQLLSSAVAKQEHHALGSDTNFLSWTSFDHSVAFCELHLTAMQVGGHQLHMNAASLAQQPDRFFDMLSEHKIGYTFSPNSFLAASCRAWNAADRAEKPYDFSNLNTIMVAGEANRTSSLEAAEAILREHGSSRDCVKAAYGLSETCSACVYNMDSAEWDRRQGNVFASCGKPLSQGLAMRIVNDDLTGVSDGDEGRVQLSGDVVFRRYYNNPKATAACFTPDGWFDTGDIGRLDECGKLNIVGRSKEILILGGNNYSSFEIEHAIESSSPPELELSWTACFAKWDEKNDTEGVVVLFSPKDDNTADSPALRETIQHIGRAVLLVCSTMPLDVVPLPKTQMPKSTIGKLSRQKLKQSYEAGTFDDYRLAPQKNGNASRPLQTHLQKIIASAISRETGTDMCNLGPDTELMQTGMSSLAYLRLKREVELALGGTSGNPVPMSILLSAGTIEGLELTLREHSGTAPSYNPLLAMRTTGSKPPLFLLPPGGGESMLWVPAVKLIPNRPIYALRVKGLEPNEGYFKDHEEMLNTYEKAILSIAPHGPYNLCGLCFGGVTAFEIGKRLEARGERVTLCAGLDVPPYMGRIMSRDAIKLFYVDMLAYYKIITAEQIFELEQRYLDVADSDIMERITADFGASTLSAQGLTQQKLQSWCKVSEQSNSIARGYAPQGQVEKYDVFWVPPLAALKISEDTWLGYLREWEPHAGQLDFHRIRGNHFTVLENENVDVFARQLEKVLRQREEPAGGVSEYTK